MAKRPKPKTQSITIKDVPTEYVELFNELVKWFPEKYNYRHIEQIHTSPKAKPDMPRGELRTLFFCELIHQTYDKEFSARSAEEAIQRHVRRRDSANNDVTP